MFLYTYYKLYNNESQFFCAIKSQFFVFLLKFGKLVAYRRVRLCRFTTKQGGMQRRPAAKRERAGRRARRRIICGIQRRFARILRIRYTKKRSFFAKNGRRLCKFFARIVLIHAQFRQGKRRPNGGALWRPNKNRAEHSPCTAFCLLSALPRLKSRRLRGCPRQRRMRAGYLSRESQRL